MGDLAQALGVLVLKGSLNGGQTVRQSRPQCLADASQDDKELIARAIYQHMLGAVAAEESQFWMHWNLVPWSADLVERKSESGRTLAPGGSLTIKNTVKGEYPELKRD